MADTEQSQPASGTRKSRRKAAMKVREELANIAKDDDKKDDTKEAQKSDSPPRNTNSPDPNCAICLCKLENKSFTDSCFHMFCFVCLLEWSKIKAECPLCKQPFKSIIHNVRSYDDYDQYHLERAENPFSFEAPNGRRFRYRTTVTQDYMFGVRPSRHATRPPTMSSRTLTSTSEYRRRIYINGMHVVGLRDACRRSRNIAPVFFSSNPASSHRLVPWLNRELNALLYNHEEHVQFVLQLIIDLIKRFPIQSEEFYQHVYPFIGRHTRHFMHEFEAFAKSPFCISSYDQRAVYEQQAESVSDSDSAPSDDGNDSDVMIVSTSTAPPESSRPRRDPGAVRRQHLTPDLTPYSASLRDLLQEDDDHGPSQSGWDSPIPGPSWHLAHLPSGSLSSLQLPGTSAQPRSHSGKQKKTSGAAAAGADNSDESEAEVVWSDSDSGDEVLCVGYDKPWQERTPVLVSTDSEEEKIAKRALKAIKEMVKKEDESKKSKRRKSRSHSRHRRRRESSSSTSTRRRSRSRSRNRHERSRYTNRSKSPTRHDRHRSPSPSGSRYRRHHRSVAYEDAFGYSKQTIRSSERNSVDSRGSRHSEGRSRRKKDHHQHSKHSFSSSRSHSRSPSRNHRRMHNRDSVSKRRCRTRSSSTEIVSRHKHKKSKKHKRSRDSEKDQHNADNVQYKIVKDKKGDKKGDPLMSITIKRDKSEDIQVVSSTVDSTANARLEIEIPDNVVIRSEPVSPPPRSQGPAPSAEPSETSAEMISQESNTSSDKPRSPKKSKPSSSSGKNMENSDSSCSTSEVRKKAFKKHPSGHKKTRRPLPRIPDPLPSTVSSHTPPQSMPVLDVMSQFFPNFGSPSTCTTPVSQDYPIPGMIANYFDSRHFYLCGFPGPYMSTFPQALPSQPSSSRVTSSDQAVVVSSSEDSDVVVEMVRNTLGHRVSSSVTDSGLNLDFVDRIPGISDSISDHRSIAVSEEIDVEDSDSDAVGRSGSSRKAHAVTEVFDSDDDDSTEHRSHSESRELHGLNTVSSLHKSQSPSSTVQGPEGALMDKEGNSPRVGQPELPPSSEQITSTKVQAETPMEEDVGAEGTTTDDSMDIDVGGPELCGQAIERCGESTSATCPSEAESGSSMEIDVVGSDDTKNDSPMMVVRSSVNDPSCRNVHEQQTFLEVNQSELASSVMLSDYFQREQLSSHDDVSSDLYLNNSSAADCVRGIESTPASPCEAGACLQTPQSVSGENTALDLRKDSTNSDSKQKPTVSVPLIEGASEISSEDEEEEEDETPISKHPSHVIADVSDISSDESDYDDLSLPLDPLYSSTYPQVIDDDSTSSGNAGQSNRQAALQKTISISDVSSDEVSDEDDSDSESSRSGFSEHKPTPLTSPTSHDSDLTAPPTGSAIEDRPSHADTASHSSGELSSGEITDDSSEDQKVYDDISSSENFDSSGEASSPGPGSPPGPSSSNVPERTCPQDDSLSEGEIVSD